MVVRQARRHRPDPREPRDPRGPGRVGRTPSRAVPGRQAHGGRPSRNRPAGALARRPRPHGRSPPDAGGRRRLAVRARLAHRYRQRPGGSRLVRAGPVRGPRCRSMVTDPRPVRPLAAALADPPPPRCGAPWPRPTSRCPGLAPRAVRSDGDDGVRLGRAVRAVLGSWCTECQWDNRSSRHRGDGRRAGRRRPAAYRLGGARDRRGHGRGRFVIRGRTLSDYVHDHEPRRWRR